VFRTKQLQLAALVLVACGRIDEGSTDSTADSETGGQTGDVEPAGGSGAASGSGSGPTGTGGDDATGGEVATGGDVACAAGSGASTGGGASVLPEVWSPCGREYPGLEPPCRESDVTGSLSRCGLWFDIPLTQVVPPACGLEVVLLPPALGGDDGGAGGMPTQPYALEVFSVFPEEPPWESGKVFDLVTPAGFVRAGARQGEPRGYVTEANGYGVATVALRQGGETLAVYRGLYGRPASEYCIK
jgi:hypothetical protein